MTTHLTKAQRDILTRLSDGDEMTQDWVTGTCHWKANHTFAPKQTVDALHMRDYVEPHFWHYSEAGRAQQYIRITDAGRAALKASER